VDLTQPWQIDLMLWMRDVLPGLVGLFEAVTSLGGEMFFLIAVPLLTWCIDRRTGARLTVVFLISTYANCGLKSLFSSPRPMDVASERLDPLFVDGIADARERYDATGYGFPSGHTQATAVVWGYLIHVTAGLRRKLAASPRRHLAGAFIALAALLTVLVPLSRVYLAVHFVTDVLGGYVFGFAILAAYLWLAPSAETWLTSNGLAAQLTLAVGVPVVAALLVPSEGAVTAAGTLMGMGVGFSLERRWIGFSTQGTLVARAGRFLVGIAVLGGLYAGLKVAFDGLEPHLVWRFIRYAAVGLWGGLGAPWVFVRLRLAHSGLTGRPQEPST